ncbi:MAG: branched-chain amino acid transaminase [Candidatus Roizmanbacteria bacterium]
MKTAPLPIAYFKGKFVPIEEANVSIMTNALQYGTAFFGGIRGYFNKESGCISIFRLDDHIRRFSQSPRVIGIKLKYTSEEMKKIVLELAKKNKPQTDIYLRPFAYASSTNLSPNLEEDNIFDFALYMIELGDYLPTNRGISVCVSSWRRVSDNAIPSRAKISGSYINSGMAKLEALRHGYEEAIFLNEDGHVAEGSAMNLFIVRNGKLITPAVSENILEGITRRSIIEIALDEGIEVVERVVDRTELYVADEAFFCGTGAKVSWISQIDGREVGDEKLGPITSKLRDIFFKAVKGDDLKYESWCTKISV